MFRALILFIIFIHVSFFLYVFLEGFFFNMSFIYFFEVNAYSVIYYLSIYLSSIFHQQYQCIIFTTTVYTTRIFKSIFMIQHVEHILSSYQKERNKYKMFLNRYFSFWGQALCRAKVYIDLGYYRQGISLDFKSRLRMIIFNQIINSANILLISRIINIFYKLKIRLI